ncbi:MAG: YbbC/YhhH family protein [Peptococcaceae bacterium]|nr:YbbC/YhhH family protein [Peptococcaceae bacterium]
MLNKSLIIILASMLLMFVFLNLNIFHFLFMKGVTPINGFVPNEETAIKIAEAVWFEIYGDSIYVKQSFKAKYNVIGGYWVVTGNLPDNMYGGVPVAHIRKSDGKILYVYHSK